MRVILDLQACQSASRFRGIGRYSMSLARATVSDLTSRGHEVVIVLNASFFDESVQLKADLGLQFPQLRFVEFSIVSPSAAMQKDNQWRQMASRLLREHALACLEPDFVHVATLLADGWADDLVASVGMLGVKVPTALTHYDLIPMVMSDTYMPNDSPFRRYYLEKLDSIERADLLLAISDYSRNEALEWLGREAATVVNISSAVNDDFVASSGGLHDPERTLDRHGIPAEFLLYAPGGFDARKNLNCLLEAYSFLSPELRARHRLVIASQVDEELRSGLVWKASTFGLSPEDLIITGYLPDAELIDLYRACGAYVFPSLHEGFGLPVLEAMSCGAVVIASNCTSIPEAHGLEEALFDPTDPSSIADKMRSALTDEAFKARLRAHATRQPGLFSWARSAKLACDAMETHHEKLCKDGWNKISADSLPEAESILDRLSEMSLGVLPSSNDLEVFHACYKNNQRGVI